MNKLADKREALRHRTFLLMFHILLIFGIPAGIGFFIGRWIDQTYAMRPYGSMAVLGITLICSWLVVIRLYQKVSVAFRALEKEEEEAREKKQEELKNDLNSSIKQEELKNDLNSSIKED